MKKIKNSKNKSGFTLVETIAALAIVSILFLGASTLVMSTNKNSYESNYKILGTTTLQGISTFLFSEDNKYFNDNLKDRTIIIQSSSLNGLIDTLKNNIIPGKEIYFNNNDKEINYILYLNTKKIKANLYGVEAKIYTIYNNAHYSVPKENPILYGQKNGNEYTENLIIRPKP